MLVDWHAPEAYETCQLNWPNEVNQIKSIHIEKNILVSGFCDDIGNFDCTIDDFIPRFMNYMKRNFYGNIFSLQWKEILNIFFLSYEKKFHWIKMIKWTWLDEFVQISNEKLTEIWNLTETNFWKMIYL